MTQPELDDAARPSTAGRYRRLPAPERRVAIVEAALRVFACGSYAASTTAEIAREAGVSEPILYRHFASKRDLYFACLEEAWSRLRAVTDAADAPLGDVVLQTMPLRVAMANLWMQAITEAGRDPEVREFVRRHIREVHDAHADWMRQAQSRGGVASDRDPSAEAWIFLGGALLLSLGDRLGGLIGEDDFARIRAERLRWLTGSG